jgi:hypothetical protein
MVDVKEMCDGCFKIEDGRCKCYADPSAWARKGGCPMKTNRVIEVKNDGKKLNPIKRSKRRGR